MIRCLKNDKIVDISTLSNCIKLSRNNINDISALSNCAELSILNLKKMKYKSGKEINIFLLGQKN